MSELIYRQGTEDNRAWLYDLYSRTLKPYVEATWGWDDAYQRAEFHRNLPPALFQVVYSGESRVGAYCLIEKEGHLWLEMLLIEPDFQGTGIGRGVMERVQAQARKRGVPLQLSVIKVNPVVPFYRKLGFEQYHEDDWFYWFRWNG